MSGALLVQAAPNGTTASTLYTATLRVEVTRLVVANTANAARTWSLFHDESGAGTYTAAKALFYQNAIAANTTYVLDAASTGSGFSLNKGAKIGAAPSAASDITFTLYGVPQAPR